MSVEIKYQILTYWKSHLTLSFKFFFHFIIHAIHTNPRIINRTLRHNAFFQSQHIQLLFVVTLISGWFACKFSTLISTKRKNSENFHRQSSPSKVHKKFFGNWDSMKSYDEGKSENGKNWENYDKSYNFGIFRTFSSLKRDSERT